MAALEVASFHPFDIFEMPVGLKYKGAPVKLVVYPGAYHDFDIPDAAGGRRYYGHWLKYDAGAAARSTAAMHDFLAAQLK
jgi:dienelactone hydrolase